MSKELEQVSCKKEPLTIEESISRLETLFKSYQKDSEFNYQLTNSDSPFNQLKKLVSWQPIENYQVGKHDWVLVQFEEIETKYRLIPRMAEFRNGKWTILSDDANEVRYLNEMCKAIAFVDIQAQIIPIEKEETKNSEEPTPLQALEKVKMAEVDIGGGCSTRLYHTKQYSIIKTTLEENEKLKELYRTEMKTSGYYNNLALEHKRAVEIIKEHRLDIDWFLQFVKQDISYKHYVYCVEKSDNKFAKRFLLKEEEYNFLKEILK